MRTLGRHRSKACSWLARLLLPTLAAAVLIAVAPGPRDAYADDRCDEQQDSGDGKGKNYRTVRGADGRKIFVIEKAFVVCGKVPKPQVFYVLHQRNINYEWENLKQDFLPKVLDSVKKDPF